MKALVAWRMIAHEKGRSALAIGGILVAILLMFLQLGFYMSVPQGGLLFYDKMRFDLMLASSSYVFEAQASTFPRRRLLQALALPEVTQIAPLYQESGRWLNADGRLARDVFVIGFNPNDVIFDLPEVMSQSDVLRRPDTILVDTASRPEFGSIGVGRQIEIDHRNVTIGGTYQLGTGFVGLGVAMTSDLNFVRIFPRQKLSDVSLGLITLQRGADPAEVVARLRGILPADTQVFTRREFTNHEINHWVTRTSTGLIFGFGVVVAIAVGLVILNQTLSTQIMRNLPQYATLKAMGFGETHISGIVAAVAIILSTISYIPAVGLALILYEIIRRATLLPIEMTSARMLAVLALAWGMSALSAIVALRVLRRADPVELF